LPGELQTKILQKLCKTGALLVQTPDERPRTQPESLSDAVDRSFSVRQQRRDNVLDSRCPVAHLRAATQEQILTIPFEQRIKIWVSVHHHYISDVERKYNLIPTCTEFDFTTEKYP
jgi:hypothetical protein